MGDLGDVFDAGQAEFAVLGPVLWNPLGEATVVEAAPRPGDRVLDVCCGAGSSAIPAARAVGTSGHVDAVDLAERLLEQGRASARGLTQIDFVHADATTWPHRDYDIVQCVFGIFFLPPDLDAAGDHLVALCRPGGKFVVTTWGADAIHVVPGVLGEAVEAEGGEVQPRGASGNRIDTTEKFEDWLGQRGLRDVRVMTKEHSMPLTRDNAWALVMGSAMRMRLNGVAESLLPRVRARFLDLLADRKVDHVNGVSLIGVGRTA
jgi:ubiquinone/menaquinone biosynthesis C-methylase UbiE